MEHSDLERTNESISDLLVTISQSCGTVGVRESRMQLD